MKKQEKLALLMSFQVLLTHLTGCSKGIQKIGNNELIEATTLVEDFKESNEKEIYNKKIEILEHIEEPIEYQESQVELRDEQVEPQEIQEVEIEICEEQIEPQELVVEFQKEISITNGCEENEIIDMESNTEEIIEDNTNNETIEIMNTPVYNETSIIDTILLDDKSLGNNGRLYFNDMSSVGLNKVSLYDEELTQSVVDNKDSAAIFNFGNSVVIADHRNQEFSVLKNIQEGDIAYIKHDDRVDNYTCIEKTYGENTGYELVLEDGRIVSEITDYDIVMYTCNCNWHKVIITLWKKEYEKVLTKTND